MTPYIVLSGINAIQTFDINNIIQTAIATRTTANTLTCSLSACNYLSISYIWYQWNTPLLLTDVFILQNQQFPIIAVHVLAFVRIHFNVVYFKPEQWLRNCWLIRFPCDRWKPYNFINLQ